MGWLNDLAYRFTIKPRMAKLQRLLPEASIWPAGSRYICNPPVWTTDIDFVVWSPEEVDSRLEAAGYKASQRDNYHFPQNDLEPEFVPWRRKNINVIWMRSLVDAERFNTATHVCKRWNLRRKHNRVGVHEAFRGVWPTGWNVNTYDLPPALSDFLSQLNGPYGAAIYKTYRVQHGLDSECTSKTS